MALWIPNAFPIYCGSVYSAIKASLGASLNPFPILSKTLIPRTIGRAVATAKRGLLKTDTPYHNANNGFLFFILSEINPEITLKNAAVVSAAPSTNPITDAQAPRLARYKGIKGKTI